MSRSTRMRTRVSNLLGDKALTNFTKQDIYRIMDNVQRKICEEANAYQTAGTVNITSGTESYAFPDGFLTEIAVAYGTHATVTDSNIIQEGYIDGSQEVIVNSTDTLLTWDTPFVKTYVGLTGTTTPAYYFGVQSARVGSSTIEESITVVSYTLTTITLKSTSDNTTVRFKAWE